MMAPYPSFVSDVGQSFSKQNGTTENYFISVKSKTSTSVLRVSNSSNNPIIFEKSTGWYPMNT